MDVNSQQYKPVLSIANYLLCGSKSSKHQSLGFELEHFVVQKGTHEPVSFLSPHGSNEASVEEILKRLKPYYNEAVYESDGGPSYLFGLFRNKLAVTLEPGSQLEASIGPTCSVAQIEEIYAGFRSELDPILDDMGLELVERGYHPTTQARNLSLLPKSRYRVMNEHFARTGKHGICMMRATASTQVSIDFKDEQDALMKLRIANVLGPLFAFITDNSAVFEGEQVAAAGGIHAIASSGLAVPQRMARMACWDDTDAARSLIAPHSFENNYSFKTYAAQMLASPALFLPPTDSAQGTVYLEDKTFEDVLANEELDEEMILHILSLFFYDARFKTYLELRQADALPLAYALSFTALIRGIFYNTAALEYYTKLSSTLDAHAVALAKSELRSQAYNAQVYGYNAAELLDELFTFAYEGLQDDEREYLEPLALLVEQRTTLVDGMN